MRPFSFFEDAHLAPHRIFRQTWPAALVLLAALILAWLAYRPGLNSGFLFDDAANLPALGAEGPVHDVASTLRYLTSGKADPAGRPVAMASFLVDARNWPASPAPFKRTNLILHGINAALLFLLLLELGRATLLAPGKAAIAAAMGAGIWLLHPFFVSTVLYIVQREAMLSTTFVALGLWVWLRARRVVQETGHEHTGRMLAVLVVVTALAVFSKANGILLPLLILVVSACLPAPCGEQLALLTFNRGVRVFAMAGAGLVLIGLIAVAFAVDPLPGRGWSTTQRLLTEPRILVDYAARLWLLRDSVGTFFHDDIVASRSLWEPVSTAVSLAAVLVTGVLAWMGRRRYAILALPVLFFLAGHAMESTTIPLELYFEHRNYLPAMLMFWPIGVGIARIPYRVPAALLAAVILGGLAVVTWTNASLWGQPLSQAVDWASRNWASPRAQAYAAQLESDAGLYSRAMGRLSPLDNRFANEPQIQLNRIDTACRAIHRLRGDVIASAESSLRGMRSDPGALLTGWFTPAIEQAASGRCAGMDLTVIGNLLRAASDSPLLAENPGRRQDVAHLQGLLALRQDAPDAALEAFNRALTDDPKVAVALEQAATLGRSGYPSQGIAHLDYFATLKPSPVSPGKGMPWLHERVLQGQGYWQHELSHLRQVLVSDAATRQR
ncbi:hypothetical protein FHW69_000014 [Luteibacter sp. Sphag1AF]|uniref:tetratricopeptide repeat protein n=1 Tax=Luteibacter sp. Sphag1AF TaxID=2587031 RepID=UPI001607F01D|nr:tetratricopeptide repeat protein [Luteibacter sp. Sphag1AF]MBB3225424.1 hypothetical protein [Luteibacter sp. Sphag1AF]